MMNTEPNKQTKETRFSVTSGRDGFRLMMEDYVGWRHLLGEAIEFGLAAIGHPCCYRGIGRLPGVGHWSWRLLHKGLEIQHKGSVKVSEVPLTEAQYRGLGLWDDEINGTFTTPEEDMAWEAWIEDEYGVTGVGLIRDED